MAQFIDNFKDLEELGIDCESDDNLTNIFNEAANRLQTLLPNVDNQTLLTLYGYYKQGTEGTCNIAKPSWYDMKGKSKWEAWNKLGNMPSHEAKRLYIETIKRLDPDFEGSESVSSQEGWVRVSVPKFDEHVNQSEKTLTDFVREGNHEEVVKLLRNVPNAKEILGRESDEGLCMIHWAADRGLENMLRLLLEFGADINQQDSDGQTALHYASSCGHVGCIELLLARGANVNISDHDGLTPSAVASDDEIRALLTTTST